MYTYLGPAKYNSSREKRTGRSERVEEIASGVGAYYKMFRFCHDLRTFALVFYQIASEGLWG